jgi:glycosyltransferase involved in cell wall biosynthesis
VGSPALPKSVAPTVRQVNNQSISLAVPEGDRHTGSDAGVPEGRDAKRPRLLVFAYACEPDRGSEPGAGWGIVQTLSTFADCTVLVGSEHVAAIRQWDSAHTVRGLEFVEVGERWWSPPSRRHRLTKFALYLAWLRRAHKTGLRIHGRAPFDAVYHATYSTYWLPTPAVRYDVPCIWGPVGGAVTTSRGLWPMLGWRGIGSELLDLVAVRVFSMLPGTRRTWRNACVPIVQNDATLDRLPEEVRRRAVVVNHALFTEIPPVPVGPRKGYCVFVGALESRKGARLALHALTHAADSVELWLAGDGPERQALEALAERLRLSSRVRFLGRLSREKVLRLVGEAAAVIFTGLREEGGVALAEAMLMGAPVIVLGHGGVRNIVASASDRSRVALVAPADPASTARRLGEAMTRFHEHVALRTDSNLDARPARLALKTAVEEACRAVVRG